MSTCSKHVQSFKCLGREIQYRESNKHWLSYSSISNDKQHAENLKISLENKEQGAGLLCVIHPVIWLFGRVLAVNN